MLAFNFHPITKELVDMSDAELDPLETEALGEDVYMLPAHATFDEPPVIEGNKAVVWTDGHWSIVDDYRGTVYWLGGTEKTITELGAAVPDGASLTPPEPPMGEIAVLRPVTPLQLRLALRAIGLRDTVSSVIASVEDADLRGTMEDAFEYATEYIPTSPLTKQMVDFFISHPDIPLDEDGFWELWRSAQEIEA